MLYWDTVAIIGSGVGSASTAYFLRREVPGANSHVFETSEIVGERTKVTRLQWLNSVVSLTFVLFCTPIESECAVSNFNSRSLPYVQVMTKSEFFVSGFHLHEYQPITRPLASLI